jgi:hypothetical protein
VTNPKQREPRSTEDSPQKTPGVTISRRSLIIGSGVLLVFLLVAGVSIGFVAGAGSSPNNTSEQPAPASSSRPISSSPASEPALTQTPAPEPEPESYGFGEAFTTGNVTLTVNAIEAVDSLATTDGPPITPDAGGQLFVLKMVYSNSKTQADLSCGNTDLYLQLFDTEEREMAPVFETYRIPGNPECNDHLLQDTPREWSYIFQSVAGASPLALSVTETAQWLDPVWLDLQMP